MLKKSFLVATGSFIFLIGMILFPLPVPFGLPTMIIGLSILFKASNKVKRVVIRMTDKHKISHRMWQKVREYRRRKKHSSCCQKKLK